MDFPCIQQGSNNSVYDYSLYIVLQLHKNLDMDLYISHLCMLYYLDIQHLKHILVYNLEEFLCTEVNKNTMDILLGLDILKMIHKDSEHMDSMALVDFVVLEVLRIY